MSKQPNKKDKGKAVQKAEDYQLQIPVQNQFTPLTFSSIAIQKYSYKSLFLKFSKWVCYPLYWASSPHKLQTSFSDKYYFCLLYTSDAADE